MKRYLLFAGYFDNRRGGAYDLTGDYDTQEEAVTLGESDRLRVLWHDWWHVYDTEVRRVVAEGQKRTPQQRRDGNWVSDPNYGYAAGGVRKR